MRLNSKQILQFSIVGGLVLSIIGLAVFLLITTFIWVPILIINIPTIAVFALIIKLTKFGETLNKLYLQVYDWFFYQSEYPRKFLWQTIYDVMVFLFPQQNWKAMNYGYALLSTDGITLNNLSPEDQQERFQLQLYHYVASCINKFKNLNGMTVLEVGCGRGGGLSYVNRYLKPAQCIGVDYSFNQVEFCKRNYGQTQQTLFFQGDSEKLNQIEGLNEYIGKIDLVINVESSHCYGNFKNFVQQVDKCLKPGGFFCITDFRYSDSDDPKKRNNIKQMRENLESFSMKIIKEEDITVLVQKSLKLDGERKVKLINNNVHWALRPLFKKFSGLEGSSIYQSMESKETLYYCFLLQKAQ